MSTKAFLGRGWRFPVRVDHRGSIDMAAYDESIEESIRIILGTAVGERVMEPDFGCKIHDLVFYPNNANTAALVAYYVRDALVKWEPRIMDISVDAFPDRRQDNVMQVEIAYKVRRDNTLRNMVYPFYLRKEENL